MDSETGLYYLRARYMDPATATFTSMDNYAGNIYEPASLNRYLYANANPVKYCDPSGHSGLLVGQIAATSIMAVLNHADTIFIMGVISGVINTAMVKVMGGDDNEQIKAFWKGFTVGALIGTLTCFVAYVTTISIIQAGAIVGVGYSGYDIAVDLFVKHDYEGAAAKIPFLILDVLVLKRSFTVNTLLPGYDGHEYNKKNAEYLEESTNEGGSKSISYKDYDNIYQKSIHNPGKEKVMLGKYDGGGPTSYITKAGDEYTYFSLGSEWNTIKEKYGFTDDDMFKLFNEVFLDDGINGGKTFYFSHNPINDGGALGMEYEYLLKNNYIWDETTMTMKPR